MRQLARTLSLLAVLAACSLPRGAPIDREIIAGAEKPDADYEVIAVTRAALPELRLWAPTGRQGYRWLSSRGGPGSALLKAGDRIDLTIWDSQENSLLAGPGQRASRMTGLKITPQGTIFVPYVGEIQVAGLTEDEARKAVQQRLSAIAPAAQVQLTAAPGAGNTVDMVSGMASPGRYPLDARKVTILSMLARAGGIASRLRNPLVRLVRDGRSYEIRAEELFATPAANITLRGGDKVIVEEDDRFFIGLGATGKEQLVNFDRERITALEAVTMLGGLNDARANLKGVLVLRQYPKTAVSPPARHGPAKPDVVFTLDLASADGLFAARNFAINPGDTVIATESPVSTASAVLAILDRLLIAKARL